MTTKKGLKKPYTALAIAVGSGKIGYVFMVDDELCDWGLSLKAPRSPETAQAKVKNWINFYNPNIIITERLTSQSRKRRQAIGNIRVIQKFAHRTNVRHILTERIQRHDNKYKEMAVLSKQYPQITNWMPNQRRLWEAEPKNSIIFEALSYAHFLDC